MATDTDNARSMTEPMEEGISIKELLHIFRVRFGWVLGCFIIVVALAFVYLYYTVPQYESQVTILVEPIKTSSSIESLMMGSATGTTKIATEVELITSRKNIDHALSTLDLGQYVDSEGISYADPLTGMNYAKAKEKISVGTVKDTNIVRITVTDQNLVFAADFANALATSYDNLLTSIARNSQAAQREFIESQIPVNEELQRTASDALGKFRETTDIIQLSEKSGLLVQKIAYFQMRREPLRLQNQEAISLAQRYSQQLSDYGITGLVSYESLARAAETVRLLAELKTWKTEFTMYESVGLSSTPAGATVSTASPANQTRINTLTSAINQSTKEFQDYVTKRVMEGLSGRDAWADSLSREYAKAISQRFVSDVDLDVLQLMENLYSDELAQLPTLERQLLELQRDVDVYAALGLKLREMLEEVKLVEASVTGNVIMIDPAVMSNPDRPVSPNKLTILAVSVLLGGALGLLLALGLEMLDVSIRDDSQIKRIIGKDIPLLGWLPLLKIDSHEKYPSLVVWNDPQSFEAERYKLVASNMIYGKNRKRKIFSITSASMGEGKSSVVANIATSLAQFGSRILVIDGDLRLPSMERFFNLKHSEVGLVDHIVNDVPLEQCIIQPLSNVPNLHLLPPGKAPLIPPAIFASEEFDSTMEYLRNIYDYIIIDAPPLQFASELLAIAKRVDGLVVAVRAGITTKGALEDLMVSLRTVEVPIVGVVFNGVITSRAGNISKGGRYYSASYAYSYRYGNTGKKKKRSAGRHTTLWTYRKKYKKDLKQREKALRYGTDDPIFAFRSGIEGAFISVAAAAGEASVDGSGPEQGPQKVATPATPPVVERYDEVDIEAFLSDIEADPMAIGRQPSEKQSEDPEKK